MNSLRKVCQLYAKLAAIREHGAAPPYVWDYAQDQPVPAPELRVSSQRHKASERAKWRARATLQQEASISHSPLPASSLIASAKAI
jgi:hypothetical protein